MKHLKPFTTNEITKIIRKSITIKIDKTIKHLGQEHLHITTIDKNNAKLDVTRIPAIKMVYSYDVTFVKEFIIWLSNVQKNCDNYYTQEVVLNQSDFDHPDKLKNLESETWNAAVLDSGATNTVASKIWFNCYINSSNSEEKSKIQHHIGTNVYRFGNGKLVQAVENKDLPIVMGGEHVMLNTDIVQSDIPLLLSRKSMKRAGMTIDFKNDQAVAFPQKIRLINTKSGHSTIPIRPYNTILNNIATGTNTVVVLIATSETKTKIIQKLHSQFTHLSSDKLLKLLNSAGDPWNNDEELKTLIKKISAECQICQLYKKTPPQAIVGLPMATAFQKCVAMDLKFYRGKILLHLIDHATRLTTSTFVPSKEPNVIISAIFRSWI